MTELKVKCTSCGHLQRLFDYENHTFSIPSKENEAFNNWLAEHDKYIREEVIAEISREIRLLYGNEYEKKIRADAIDECADKFADILSDMPNLCGTLCPVRCNWGTEESCKEMCKKWLLEQLKGKNK